MLAGLARTGRDRMAASRSLSTRINWSTLRSSMVDARHEELQRLSSRAYNCISAAVHRDSDRIAHLKAQVRSLSPQNTLDRGYAVVQLPDGRVLRDSSDAATGTRLRVRVAVGELSADVAP